MREADVALSLSKSGIHALITQAGSLAWSKVYVKAQPMSKYSQDAFMCNK